MTTIIMTRTDKYSIVISDTKENKEENSGFIDGVFKLRFIPNMGFITGAGSATFLGDVKKSVINKRNIRHIDEVLGTFDFIAKETKRRFPEEEERTNESYIAINWLGEMNGQTEYNSALLSESYYDSIGANATMIDKGVIRVIYPVDLVEQDDLIHNIVESVKSKSTINLDINQSLSEMLKLFVQIAQESDMVSLDCQIGIQYYSMLTGEIHTEGLYGKGEKLLKFAQQNKIIRRFEPAGTLREFK